MLHPSPLGSGAIKDRDDRRRIGKLLGKVSAKLGRGHNAFDALSGWAEGEDARGGGRNEAAVIREGSGVQQFGGED